jgi:hypothetical protein
MTKGRPVPTGRDLSTILAFTGTWMILVGTVLYWPLERLNDWMETSKWFGRDGWSLTGYRFRVWLRNDPRRRWVIRGLYIVGGIICLALAFS